MIWGCVAGRTAGVLRGNSGEGREGGVGVADWRSVSVQTGLGAHKGRPCRGRRRACMPMGMDRGAGQKGGAFQACSGRLDEACRQILLAAPRVDWTHRE